MSEVRLFHIAVVIHGDIISHIWPAVVSMSLSAAGESSALGFAKPDMHPPEFTAAADQGLTFKA